MLYISTSERVLRTPFAGRNRRFSSFFVKKEGKKTKYNTKTPEKAVFFSVWELLPKAATPCYTQGAEILRVLRVWSRRGPVSAFESNQSDEKH